MAPQQVELIDEVMYDFPELTFVTRHGCEPWTGPGREADAQVAGPALLDQRLRARSTTRRTIIDYANTRGADKIIYAGYFPMGLSLERIMTDMPNVPFKDEVWPKFLRDNAARVLKLDTLKGNQHDDDHRPLHDHHRRQPCRRQPRAVPRVPRPAVRRRLRRLAGQVQEPLQGSEGRPPHAQLGQRAALEGAEQPTASSPR